MIPTPIYFTLPLVSTATVLIISSITILRYGCHKNNINDSRANGELNQRNQFRKKNIHLRLLKNKILKFDLVNGDK
jgi:hypothetical protein